MLAVNQDLRMEVQSISACLEEAAAARSGIHRVETEGAVAVDLLELKVRVGLLELALRQV